MIYVIYSLLILIEKIGFFQQTVVRVYYIYKRINRYNKKKNIERKVVSPLQLYVHDLKYICLGLPLRFLC